MNDKKKAKSDEQLNKELSDSIKALDAKLMEIMNEMHGKKKIKKQTK